jgi:hypothetical protein
MDSKIHLLLSQYLSGVITWGEVSAYAYDRLISFLKSNQYSTEDLFCYPIYVEICSKENDDHCEKAYRLLHIVQGEKHYSYSFVIQTNLTKSDQIDSLLKLYHKIYCNQFLNEQEAGIWFDLIDRILYSPVHTLNELMEKELAELLSGIPVLPSDSYEFNVAGCSLQLNDLFSDKLHYVISEYFKAFSMTSFISINLDYAPCNLRIRLLDISSKTKLEIEDQFHNKMF